MHHRLIGLLLCIACTDRRAPLSSDVTTRQCDDKLVLLVSDPTVDIRVINKVLNTTKAAGLTVAMTRQALPPACVLAVPIIQISRSEITLRGQLVATTESVLRDDSPTFKVDALFVGLQVTGPQVTSNQITSPSVAPVTSGERYRDYGRNGWVLTANDRLSTFAADVDTASYTITRRKLGEGVLPPPAAVRVEEFVNYFEYTSAVPTASPFAVVMDASPSPLAPSQHIVRLNVATKPISTGERLPAHLVFLVDVSGSMESDDKLPLAKQALRILTQQLTAADTVSLVTYAGSTRVVLEPTSAKHKRRIISAIDRLRAAGSTAMASGIDLAYARAIKNVRPGHNSRVIVLSDGDANVGAHTHDEILEIISSRATEGVTLSTIGFGMGNYNDELMEQLADKGNGNNFYVDSIDAAQRVFADKLTANLEVVAKDVKLQVDFDPAMVGRYRLVGYENRDIADRDFRNDKVDAGEVGAGHQVTALYEVELTTLGKFAQAPLGGIRIRYKQPQGTTATEAAFPMVGGPAASFAQASVDFRFAVAVAAFADVLRGSADSSTWSLAMIRDIANAAAGNRAERKELVDLVDMAIRIRGPVAVSRVQP